MAKTSNAKHAVQETTPSAVKPRVFYVSNSSVDKTGGRYCSHTPEAAARKAGCKLFRGVVDDGGVKDVTFVLNEKNTNKPGRRYNVTRKKRDKPSVVVRDGTEVVYNFDYEVRALGRIEEEATKARPTKNVTSPKKVETKPKEPASKAKAAPKDAPKEAPKAKDAPKQKVNKDAAKPAPKAAKPAPKAAKPEPKAAPKTAPAKPAPKEAPKAAKPAETKAASPKQRRK